MNQTTNNAAAVAEPSGAHAAVTPELTGGRSVNSIEAALKAKLDPAHVKSREQGSSKVQYIEGWHVIEEANRIFGHLSWSRETVLLREVCRYENHKGNHVVGYEAKVTVTVHFPGIGRVVREGSGYGSGIAKDLFSAIESAGKEAETDAMKRALMTFGNPMGLALYDKSRANVGSDDLQPKPKATQAPKPKLTPVEAYEAFKKKIEATETEEALRTLTDTSNYKRLLEALDGKPEKASIMQLVTERFEKLMPPSPDSYAAA